MTPDDERDRPMPDDPATPYTDRDGGDSVHYLPNGFVRFDLDGSGEIMLRRPTIGELRTLLEGLADTNDTIQAHSRKLYATQQELRRERERYDDEWEPEADDLDGRIAERQEREAEIEALRQRDRQASRDADRFADEQTYGWLREAVETLAVRGDLPDDPPGWMSSPQLPRKLADHWRTVPSAPGS